MIAEVWVGQTDASSSGEIFITPKIAYGSQIVYVYFNKTGALVFFAAIRTCSSPG